MKILRWAKGLGKVFALATPMLLVACTQPLFCPSGDWERVGFSDGLYGKDRTYFEGYRPKCASSGRTPDAGLWTRGYERGIALYCTERNAYRIGLYGQGWFNTRACPATDQRRLDDAYHQGYVYREMLEDLRERQYRWPYHPVFPHYPFY